MTMKVLMMLIPAVLAAPLLAGCANTPQGCIVAHSPSVKVDGAVLIASRTTEVCAAYVEVSGQILKP